MLQVRQSGLPVGESALMGLEAKRSWGPSALLQVRQSGLPVGESALMGLEAKRSWGPSALLQVLSELGEHLGERNSAGNGANIRESCTLYI
jgi:hypothetical protein